VVKEPSVKKKPRRLGETRIEDAIGGFQDTLVDFCTAVLSSGSRNGMEWVYRIWIIRPGMIEGLEAVV
jgi:hypothetical protein